MKKNTLQSGFTLIELMVSIAIFTIVVVAVIGSVYTANASARKVQATETVLNNVNFALESIARTIRTGTIVSCTADTVIVASLAPDNVSGYPNCNTQNQDGFIVVHNTLGTESFVKYYFGDDDSVQKQTLAVVGGVPTGSWSEPIAITAPSVSVKSIRFNFVGLAAGSTHQRGASINISGLAKTEKDSTPFAIQTFVSQRNF